MRYTGYLIEEADTKVEIRKAVEDLMEEGGYRSAVDQSPSVQME